MNTGIQRQFCRKKAVLSLFFSACFFCALSFSAPRLRMPDLLRIHVLANSESEEDQQLKEEVRLQLLRELDRLIRPEMRSVSKEYTARLLLNCRPELEKKLTAYIRSRGFSYPVVIRREPCYFPERKLSGRVYPCGIYDSVRVIIGEGRGHNWWSVLYPPLCFSGSGCREETVSSEKESAVTVRVKLRLPEFLRSLSLRHHF